jgi:tRNA dimethylallyltransferase
VLEGLDEIPEADETAKNQVRRWFSEKGISFLQEKLQEADPVYFQKTDAENPVRLMRALEVFYSTGKPFSSFHSGKKTIRPFHAAVIALDVPKEILYQHIDERVDKMMRNGLLEEATNLFPLKDIHALQTVGYSELFDYLEGKSSLEEAISLIKQHTRNFAKRQITWFKKMNHVAWLPASTESILFYIQNEMKRHSV